MAPGKDGGHYQSLGLSGVELHLAILTVSSRRNKHLSGSPIGGPRDTFGVGHAVGVTLRFYRSFDRGEEPQDQADQGDS